ncbi:MAG: DUF4199 domain-containing protein [Bacteroidales bacterium]|nr:DUF4199 domain-containing protein [Bacteroidales bacterium]
MENTTTPVWKHSLIFGLYLGIALIIFSLLIYLLDMMTVSWVGYISYLLILAGVIFSSINYRDRHLNGFISYGQSLSAGFLTGLFAGILSAIFTYIFVTIMGEQYMQELLVAAEENIINSRPDITDEELDLAMGFTKNMMRPGWMSLMGFLGTAFFSLVFALIASIFIKKEDQNNLSETAV